VTVRDTIIQKYGAFRQESVARIEWQRVRLSVQASLRETRFVCHPHEFLQQSAANPTTSPSLHDSHTPDVSIRQQSAGADGLTSGGLRKHMRAHLVQIVPFQIHRDLLFIDEDQLAYCFTSLRASRHSTRLTVNGNRLLIDVGYTVSLGNVGNRIDAKSVE
jgi:hypothetical protein